MKNKIKQEILQVLRQLYRPSSKTEEHKLESLAEKATLKTLDIWNSLITVEKDDPSKEGRLEDRMTELRGFAEMLSLCIVEIQKHSLDLSYLDDLSGPEQGAIIQQYFIERTSRNREPNLSQLFGRTLDNNQKNEIRAKIGLLTAKWGCRLIHRLSNEVRGFISRFIKRIREEQDEKL